MRGLLQKKKKNNKSGNLESALHRIIGAMKVLENKRAATRRICRGIIQHISSCQYYFFTEERRGQCI